MRIFLFFLAVVTLPLLVKSQPTHNYKNLVLEGAGVRGLAYAGAFAALEENGILQGIEKVAGTSSGAIAGMFLSLGYRAEELRKIMEDLPVQQFNDGNWGLAGKYFRFRKKFGIYKGNEFEAWLQKRVKAKTNDPCLSFAQLHLLHLKDNIYKDLYCTGTNLSKQKLEIFSWKTTPDMSIALAVRISSGVPLYFEPVVLDNDLCRISKKDTSSYRNYYVDGGIISNYPISLFDSCRIKGEPAATCEDAVFNLQTLGIKLERAAQIDSLEQGQITIPPFEIMNLSDYAKAFANIMMESLARHYPKLENEKGRTIYINQGGISPQVKKTKEKDKLLLYTNGKKGVNTFFNSSFK